MKPLVAIMGAPVSTGNRGVMALGTSLVGLCLEADPEARVVFLVGNKDDQPVHLKHNGKNLLIPVINYRMSPRSGIRQHLLWILLMAVLYRILPFSFIRRVIVQATPWIKILSEANLVGDVRGGDSFSDIYGLNRFLLGFLPVWAVLLVRRQIVLFPQTYGPYSNRLAKIMAAYIMRRASPIIARDRQSQELAQAMVGSSKSVLLSPDVAFSLEFIKPERLKVIPPMEGNLFEKPVIGLNVNGLMFNGGYTRRNMFDLKLEYPSFLTKLVPALLAEHPGDLLLVPHTYAQPGNVESDNEACRLLRDSLSEDMKGRVYMLAEEYDPHELKGIIGKADFFIGSRMHSCIAALSQGVPCVGVAYSRKFEGVFDTVGMAEWVVDGGRLSSAEAVERVLELFRKREAIRDNLLRSAEGARKQLSDVFNKMFSSDILY